MELLFGQHANGSTRVFESEFRKQHSLLWFWPKNAILNVIFSKFMLFWYYSFVIISIFLKGCFIFTEWCGQKTTIMIMLCGFFCAMWLLLAIKDLRIVLKRNASKLMPDEILQNSSSTRSWWYNNNNNKNWVILKTTAVVLRITQCTVLTLSLAVKNISIVP